MRSFEIFDGDRYLFTIMPSERPRQVLREERRRSRNPRLRLIEIDGGIRRQVEGPGTPEPEDENFGYDNALYED